VRESKTLLRAGEQTGAGKPNRCRVDTLPLAGELHSYQRYLSSNRKTSSST